MSSPRKKDEKISVKRYDTRVDSIEKKYGVDLGVKPGMKLGNYLKQKGYSSLSDMLKP